MRELSFTLLSDGSSDRAILPLLRKLLEELCPNVAFQEAWADLRRLRSPPSELEERIRLSLLLYPCRLLFVHRDAEKQSPELRRHEIATALDKAQRGDVEWPEAVCVIPVRMQEAWLLVDEAAIRRAAGNPNGTVPLELPAPSRLEALPDPKTVLHDTLRSASGLRGVRRRRLNVRASVHRIADFIDDLSELRRLQAFIRLEEDLQRAVTQLGLGG